MVCLQKIDQPLAGFYPDSGMPTACLTRKKKKCNPISKLCVVIQLPSYFQRQCCTDKNPPPF